MGLLRTRYVIIDTIARSRHRSIGQKRLTSLTFSTRVVPPQYLQADDVEHLGTCSLPHQLSAVGFITVLLRSFCL